MPLAHHCLHCGHDLARLRPMRDPFYRLPVIICPTCSNAAVRRRHPMLEWWRWARGLDLAGGILVLQLGILTFFTAATIGGVLWTGEEFLPDYFPPDFDTLRGDIIVLSVALYIVAPFALGAWLVGAFPHWKVHRIWVAWFGWILLWCVLMLAYTFISRYLWHRYRWEIPFSFFEFVRSVGHHDPAIRSLEQGLLYVPWQMIIATLGIPVGLAFRWLTDVAWRSMSRVRRRRRRRLLHPD